MVSLGSLPLFRIGRSASVDDAAVGGERGVGDDAVAGVGAEGGMGLFVVFKDALFEG